MSLDLGTLRGLVTLDTAVFDRAYVGVIRKMTVLGDAGAKSAAGTAKLDTSLGGLAGSSGKAATATDVLAVSLGRSEGATSGAALAASKLTQAQLRQAAAQERIDTLQTAGTASAGRLAAAQASLVAATDRTAVAEERVAKSSGLIGSTRGAWAAIPGPVKMAAAAVAAVGAVSIDAAAKFQSATIRIQTQAGGTAKQVAAVSSGILRMAGAVATAPAALADAAYHIASVGQKSLTTAQQLQVLRIAAEGAKIGGANLTDVTNGLDAAIVSGIQGVQNYSQAMGALNAVVGAGDMSMQDLSDALGTGVLAVVKGYGVTLSQAGAALAVFGDNNIRGAAAATGLRMAVQSLTKPASTAKDALATLGLTGQNAMSHFAHDLQQGGLTKALDDLHQRLVDSGVGAKAWGEILTNAFTKRAGVGLSILIEQMGRYQNKEAEVNAGAKRFSSDWTAYTHTFAFAADAVKAAAESLGIQLGDKLLPSATKALRWIGTNGVADLQAFGHAVASNSMITGGFSALEAAFGHIAAAVGHTIVALEPLGRVLLAVGGGAALIGFRALATILDGVAAAADHLTGFFAHNQTAAIALSAAIGTALVPSIAEAVMWFGRMIAMNAGAMLMVLRGAVIAAGDAFLAAGGGVAGFNAALKSLNLNPIMLAITAVVAASAELIHVFNGQMHAAQAAGRAMADDYVASLNHANVALATTRGNTASLGQAMVEAVRGGGGIGQLSGQLSELGKAYKQSAADAKTMQANETQLASQFGMSRSQVEALAKANGINLAQSYQQVSAAVVAVIGPSATLHQALITLGRAAQGSATSAQALNAQLAIMAGDSLSADQAAIAFRNDIVALDKALKKSHGSLSLNSQAGRDARTAFDAAAQGAISSANAEAKLKGGLDKARASLQNQIAMLKAHAGNSAYAKSEIDKLQGALAKLPSVASAAASGVAGSGHKMVSATASTVAAVVAQIRAGDSQAHSAGVNFGNSYAAGIAATAAATGISAARIVTNAINAVNHAQQSNSPSRVGMRLGSWFGAGYALGIDSQTTRIRESARRMVEAAVSATVAPAVTDPNQLAQTLGADIHRAVGLQATASHGKNQYQRAAAAARDAAHALTALQRADNQAEAAAKRHAQALSNEAHAAHEAAANMNGTGKAAAAAKHTAEVHARALDDEARAASQAATALANADAKKEKSAQHAADVAQKAADKAKAAYQKEASAAQAAAQVAAQAAQDLVSNLTDTANQMMSTITDFKNRISGDITGDDTLTTLWQQLTGTDANGDPLTPSLTGLQSSLDAILAQAQQFSADLTTLTGEGASQDLISQLADMGSTAGDALAQQLLAAGPSAVAALSATMTAISTVAGTEAQSLADAFYGPGVDAMVQFIEGLESKFPELKRALDAVLAMIGAAGFPTASAPAGAVTSGSGSWGLIPKGFASGVQNFGGGLALVGERGPEYVTLPHGASVYPHGTAPRGGDGASLLDMTAVVDRLDRIEGHLAVAPERTGAAVGEASIEGYKAAGAAHAREMSVHRRAGRI